LLAGKTLWTKQPPTGMNALLAIDGNTLVVGAAATGFTANPHLLHVAYPLSHPTLFILGGPAMAQLTHRSLLALATTAIAALTLAPTATAYADRQTDATATTINVTGSEFLFKLSTKSLAKAGTTTFVFKNAGHVQHDFKIDGKTTPLLQPGKTARLVVRFTKPGKYPYLCTVPGHAAAGMKGTFTVR
jgi:uncharacterized cupredoxin-like copper-binding protein